MLSYLAAPYAHKDPAIRHFRYEMITAVAAKLIQEGTFVFSPITHNIPLKCYGLSGDWEKWEKFDLTYLGRCDQLIVLKLPGWEASKGVSAEIAFAEKHQIPIQMIEPLEILKERSVAVDLFAEALQHFFNERDWDQFHSPKNLACNLAVEVGELLDHFRWLSDEESYQPHDMEEVKNEMGDVLISLIALSEKLNINLFEVGFSKLKKIGKKYPVEQSVGNNQKMSYAQQKS